MFGTAVAWSAELQACPAVCADRWKKQASFWPSFAKDSLMLDFYCPAGPSDHMCIPRACAHSYGFSHRCLKMKHDKYTVLFGYLGYFLMMIPSCITMSEFSIFVCCP